MTSVDTFTLRALIADDFIVPALRSRDRGGILRELAEALAWGHPTLHPSEVERALAEREGKGSTALGDGVAIPHAKLPSAQGVVACMGRSREGVAFDAPDRKPVHLFVALIAPEDGHGSHLIALARISHLLRDSGVRGALLAAPTREEMAAVIEGAGGR